MEIIIVCTGRSTERSAPEIAKYWECWDRVDLWMEKTLTWDRSRLAKMIARSHQEVIRVPWNINVLFWMRKNEDQIPWNLKGRKLTFDGTIFVLEDKFYTRPTLAFSKETEGWATHLEPETVPDYRLRRPHKNKMAGHRNRHQDERENSKVVSLFRPVRQS